MAFIDKALSYLGYTKSISTTDPIIAQFLSGTDTNQISKPYANIPPVYKAVKAIIDNIAQVKIKTVDKEQKEKNDEQINKLLTNIYDDNGAKISGSDFLQKMAGFYCLYGEIFLQKEAETLGQLQGTQLPYGLTILDPNKMQAVVNEKRQILSWNYYGARIEPQKIIHIKDFNPYDVNRGLSPVKVILDELRLESGSSSYQVALLDNGAMPSLILETETRMTIDQQKELRRAWESRHQGSKKAGKMAVLEGGLKAKTLSHSPHDMQFVEVIKIIEEKIIGTWRVPKAMFGYTDNLNYATFQGQLKAFWEMTIIPLLMKIESGLNGSLFNIDSKSTLIKFDLAGVKALSSNLQELSSTIQTLTNSGFTRNEINAKLELGFENQSWGDSWWIPFSMVEAGTSTITEPQPTKEVKKKSTDDLITAENGLQYTKKAYQFIKNFNHLHDKLHIKFRSAVRAYFNGQRKRMLDAIDDTYLGLKTVNKAVQININWDKEADLYSEKMKPYYLDAVEQGVNVGSTATGLQSSDRLKYSTNSATISRLNKIKVEITETTKDKLNSTINEGVNAGESVEQIKNRVREYFNRTDNRSEVIARTETTSQLNAGLFLQYDDVGIEEKMWVTTLDQFTRDTHAALNGEVVKLNQAFSNGLMYPADEGEPEQVINCRCSVLPV